MSWIKELGENIRVESSFPWNAKGGITCGGMRLAAQEIIKKFIILYVVLIH